MPYKTPEEILKIWRDRGYSMEMKYAEIGELHPGEITLTLTMYLHECSEQEEDPYDYAMRGI